MRVRPDLLGAEKALRLVANQWFVVVLHTLHSRTLRYSELQRAIPSVTKKMLTQTLRNMERDGLVLRTLYPEVPPRTEYSLTPLGNTLVEPLAILCHWATEHFDEVEASRGRSDDAAAV